MSVATIDQLLKGALVAVAGFVPAAAFGQSSSLWAVATTEPQAATAAPAVRSDDTEKPKSHPVLEANSFIAVKRPSPRKFRKHDILTIVVNESKRSQTRKRFDYDKEYTLDAGVDEWLRLRGNKLIPASFRAGIPGMKLDFETEFESTGRARNDERLITRVSVTVVDIKPNGNLVLEGRKYIKEDEEERIMTLTGECRSADVLPDNTLLSTQVANLVIDSSSTGALRDASRRGWIPRIFDFLRPF